MVDVTIRLVDFMDARPLPRSTLDVSLTVVALFPPLPEDGPGPPLEPRPDARFAEVLTESVVTDANGRADVSFDDADAFARVSVMERANTRAVGAVATLRSGAAFFGIQFEPRVLASGLERDARLDHTLPVDLGMSIVGHTTARTARLWFHLPFTPADDHRFICSVATVEVNAPAGLLGPVGPHEAALPGREFPVSFAPQRKAITEVLDVDGLPADHEHSYTLLVQRGNRRFGLVNGRFRTPAEGQRDVAFAFGSCHLPVVSGTPDQPSEESRRSLELWQRLADRRGEFEALLLIGDQIYGDGIEDKWPDDDPLDRYVRRYQQLWAYRPVREVFRSTPTYMIIDDHDVVDDFGLKDLPDQIVVAAQDAYELFQHAHNPGDRAGPPYHYSFTWGPAAFFVMDGRTRRGDDTPVFGRHQLRDLQRWAASQEVRAADVIFFVAPIPLALLPTEIIRKTADDLAEQAVVAGMAAGALAGLGLGFLGIPAPFPGVGGALSTAAVIGAVGFTLEEVTEELRDRALLLEADLGERWDLRENQPDLIVLLDLLFDLANGVGEARPRKRAVFILSGDIHAGTMHGIRSLPIGAGQRHTANPVLTQLTSSALSRQPVNSTLWMEAVSRSSPDLDLDLHEIDLLAVWEQRHDWEGLSRGVIDVDDVFGDGKGEYFLDPNHESRYLTQYAGLLMERTVGFVRVERRHPQRRSYRFHLVIEGQSNKRLSTTLDMDLDAPSSPGLELSPSPVSFGPVEELRTLSLKIKNVAGAPVRVTVAASPTNAIFRWPAVDEVLEHTAERRLPIEFRPTSSAIVQRTLTLTSTAPDSPHRVTLMGKGPGGLPTDPEPPLPTRLKVTPSALAFGSVKVDESTTRAFTIENPTGSSVNVTIPASPAGSPFGWSAFSGPVPNGVKRTVLIRFEPKAKGTFGATVTVSSSAPGGSHSVALVGKGGIGGFEQPNPE